MFKLRHLQSNELTTGPEVDAAVDVVRVPHALSRTRRQFFRIDDPNLATFPENEVIGSFGSLGVQPDPLPYLSLEAMALVA
jgi:hypothetical protein